MANAIAAMAREGGCEEILGRHGRELASSAERRRRRRSDGGPQQQCDGLSVFREAKLHCAEEMIEEEELWSLFRRQMLVS